MGVVMIVNRYEVFLVKLDPTMGSEIQKTRPCLIISPDEINHQLPRVIIAPLTTKGYPSTTRVPCHFRGKKGQVILDQIRTVDKMRLVKKLGVLPRNRALHVLSVLRTMFRP